ncbi:prephenate dehydrogenase/arogenate dehydrogenase family protein [Micromonospora sp. WMMD812]|uniref:prephenate dehydrogenase n=1 Tax=Micromonospora sp. WMMD812 TaxID=3015152 RepID=UPI00248C2A6F|nr:prephenate dehydrogenase/arogenate dehydrogenase family protein [Micromonospora sp. WMMD812]WBB66553.1 prephenate dehydrogenase/arogenate dehydrogenase family protein [Micromonospora sp. WMMD812]
MVGRTGAPARATVIGTGLIGGSILLRLRAVGLDVAGWDPEPATRAEARHQGVDAPETLEAAVAGRDVVFLCGPLPTLPETLLRVAELTGPACVLTDVGSTKAELAAFAVQHRLADRFVPGHPMAGADTAGIKAATPTLLGSAAWVLCPTPGVAMSAFRWLAGLLADVFAARVVPMSPEEHDAVVALSSHLPHLLAGALAGAVQRSALRDAVLALAAGSFRDGTRVAGHPPERTANMLLSNRERVLGGLAGIRAFVDEVAAALRDGDAATLTARHRESRAARVALTGRTFVTRQRRFAVDADDAAEVAHLLALGASGGHLTGCRVAHDVVTYAEALPEIGSGQS